MFTKIITDLNKRPDLMDAAAAWFHSKWETPAQAYLDSMAESLESDSGVPRWYVVLNENEDIIAGLGIIENDFHKRPDLTPNICALFVEEAHRHGGIANILLDNACAELAKKGIYRAYLITNHTEFYERCGWTFCDMVEEEDGNLIRMYEHRSDD